MSKWLWQLSLGIAGGALISGYAFGGMLAWILIIFAVGILWLVADFRGWGWAASLGLLAYVGAAAFGMWLGLGAAWMLLGLVATLAAWNLYDFVQRAHVSREFRDLEREFLKRLSIISGVGLMLGALALFIQTRLSFGAALVLGLLVIVGLSRAIGFLRQESN